MLNKKMLLSVLILSVVATVAGAGTWAYFDSSQAVDDNTITSGTLTLTPGSSALDAFNIGPLAPGDSGNAKTLNLVNDGNLNGYLYAEISASGESDLSDLTTTINGQTMTDGAKIYLGDLSAGDNMDINIDYDFDETGVDQNTQQGKTVTYNINYHLQQLED